MRSDGSWRANCQDLSTNRESSAYGSSEFGTPRALNTPAIDSVCSAGGTGSFEARKTTSNSPIEIGGP